MIIMCYIKCNSYYKCVLMLFLAYPPNLEVLAFVWFYVFRIMKATCVFLISQVCSPLMNLYFFKSTFPWYLLGSQLNLWGMSCFLPLCPQSTVNCQQRKKEHLHWVGTGMQIEWGQNRMMSTSKVSEIWQDCDY